jgi:hypothetical protein
MMRQKTPILSTVAAFYNPVSQLFLQRIKQIYPYVSAERLSHHWHFCLATYFSIFSDDFRVDSVDLSYRVGQNKIPDFTEAYNEATAFVFNGILPVVTHSIDAK